MNRVVITGMGAITPIGNTVSEFWSAILKGKCGIDQITHFAVENSKVKLAAEIKGYFPEEHFEYKAVKRIDRFSQLGMIAAREAFKDSKINKNQDMEKVGVFVSSGIGGLKTIEEQNEAMLKKGCDRVSPMYIPMSIVNMAAGNIAIDLGIQGESASIVTACASSTHSLGEAYRLIKHGYQEVMLAGGTESSITPTGIAGFCNMKALTQSTDKKRASIPFDKERNGFVMGEGAGVLVLEELEHAKKRGATIYAEIVGYAATTDAYHITSPEPKGSGATRAMKRAMEDALILPEQIEYINAHGTSTPLNDKCETLAIKQALGEHSSNVMISSIKGNTGHLLGAAGAVEVIACVKALQQGIIPPTIGYEKIDEECDLDYVPNQAREKKIQYAMSNSLGFGGHNSCIILKKWE